MTLQSGAITAKISGALMPKSDMRKANAEKYRKASASSLRKPGCA